MAKISVSKAKGPGCLLCIGVCPKGALKQSKSLNKLGLNYAEFQDTGACLGCALCAVVCPDCCIEIYK